VAVQLLAPSIEVGLVTTNRDAMVGFYEGYLGLTHQADLDFPGGSMKRYAVGANVVLKLVSYNDPPASPPTPGGGRAQGGIRYITLVVADVRDPVVEEPTAFPAVPGMGWCFVADPDGNWVELVGPV
jgi:catechol 2,3-dioxygenase-like lactoylglutathione lyase family enzyme